MNQKKELSAMTLRELKLELNLTKAIHSMIKPSRDVSHISFSLNGGEYITPDPAKAKARLDDIKAEIARR